MIVIKSSLDINWPTVVISLPFSFNFANTSEVSGKLRLNVNTFFYAFWIAYPD
jgi:hypothetical protein